MCEPASFQCANCDKFKNGCPGQTGTFNSDLCPEIPCGRCAQCEQSCKMSGQFRPEECIKSTQYIRNGR